MAYFSSFCIFQHIKCSYFLVNSEPCCSYKPFLIKKKCKSTQSFKIFSERSLNYDESVGYTIIKLSLGKDGSVSCGTLMGQGSQESILLNISKLEEIQKHIYLIKLYNRIVFQNKGRHSTKSNQTMCQVILKALVLKNTFWQVFNL